jgi:adenosylhomocysteinase
VVLDDGGYVYPVLKGFRDRWQSFVGIIEQTMSGIWKIGLYDQVPIPVFSVAESDLKGTIESYGVADAAVRNLLRLLPNEKFEGRRALVLGYGRIGREIASILDTKRMTVAVHDPDRLKLVAARENGFATDDDLDRLLRSHRPLIVFGCSGSPTGSLRSAHLDALRADCYLVSTTSRDREFDVGALRERAVTARSAGVAGTTYSLPDEVDVTLVADGFPINFHHAESMPNRYSDLILASMLVGACTLADPNCGFLPGHNLDRTNVVLKASGLIEAYYDQYAS